LVLTMDSWVTKWMKKGSASTVHCFQGAQAPTIIYVLPYASPFETREYVYTAWTRAMERMIHVGSHDMMINCVAKVEPVRDSSLGDRIIYHCNKFKGEVVVTDPFNVPQEVLDKREQEEGGRKEGTKKRVSQNGQTNVKKVIIERELAVEEMSTQEDSIEELTTTQDQSEPLFQELIATPQQQLAPFYSIPECILIHIISFLTDPWEVLQVFKRVGFINKKMSELITDNRIWEPLCVRYGAHYGKFDERWFKTVEDNEDYFFKRFCERTKWLRAWICGMCNEEFTSYDILKAVDLKWAINYTKTRMELKTYQYDPVRYRFYCPHCKTTKYSALVHIKDGYIRETPDRDSELVGLRPESVEIMQLDPWIDVGAYYGRFCKSWDDSANMEYSIDEEDELDRLAWCEKSV
jgi:hypothetical protein